MSTFITIPTDENGWKKSMYEDKCTCGHELYLHASTLGKYNDTSAELYVSQCTRCEYDYDSKKFICNGFVRSE